MMNNFNYSLPARFLDVTWSYSTISGSFVYLLSTNDTPFLYQVHYTASRSLTAVNKNNKCSVFIHKSLNPVKH